MLNKIKQFFISDYKNIVGCTIISFAIIGTSDMLASILTASMNKGNHDMYLNMAFFVIAFLVMYLSIKRSE